MNNLFPKGQGINRIFGGSSNSKWVNEMVIYGEGLLYPDSQSADLEKSISEFDEPPEDDE